MRTQPNLLAEARCLRSEPAAMAAVAVGRLVSPIASFSPAHCGSTLGQFWGMRTPPNLLPGMLWVIEASAESLLIVRSA
jgi:hypothetical protein